jgi:hypothetical protein
VSAELYEADFYAWTQEQSAKLRALFESRANVDLDLDNLSEEIDSMGRSFRYQLESRLTNTLEHLLKLAYSPLWEPQNMWRGSVRGQRIALQKLLRKNPSLKPVLPASLEECYEYALKVFDDEKLAELTMPPLPASCPFDLETEIMNPDWWPDPR